MRSSMPRIAEFMLEVSECEPGTNFRTAKRCKDKDGEPRAGEVSSEIARWPSERTSIHEKLSGLGFRHLCTSILGSKALAEKTVTWNWGAPKFRFGCNFGGLAGPFFLVAVSPEAVWAESSLACASLSALPFRMHRMPVSRTRNIASGDPEYFAEHFAQAMDVAVSL